MNGSPKNVGCGVGDAVRAAGEILPVEQDEPDDLAEAERDDGEIVAAQPQHRKAEQEAGEGGEDAGERQTDPERKADILREQRIGIGADRVEGDVAEIEQPGEADHDVETEAEHGVGGDQAGKTERVAVAVEQDWDHERERDERRREKARDIGRYCAVRSRQQARQQRRRARPQQAAQQTADEHRRHDFSEQAQSAS